MIMNISKHFQGDHQSCSSESPCQQPGYVPKRKPLTMPAAISAYEAALRKTLIYKNADSCHLVCNMNNISCEPEPHHGVYCSITELLSKEIENLAQSHPGLRGEYIKVKISGDGANFSRCLNFFLFSFCLINLQQRVLSPRGRAVDSKLHRTFHCISGISEGQCHSIYAHNGSEMIALYGNIKQFSYQGVEKLNDIAKCSYFSSSKWDPAQEILLTEQRMSATQHLCRKRRAYTKKDDEYWSEGIRATRKQRKMSSTT
ncbi:hypothetical protein EMCRGX_G028383 [Ephydatia muelleri]